MISNTNSSSLIATASLVLFTASIIPIMLRRRNRGQAAAASKDGIGQQQARQLLYPFASLSPEELPRHIRRLLAELTSGTVILQSDAAAFQQAVDAQWAQQNREIIPACVVCPRDAQELGKIVKILKQEYDGRRNSSSSSSHDDVVHVGPSSSSPPPPPPPPGPSAEGMGLFAVRSGGLNPGIGAATVKDGVVIDLSLICDVTPSADGSTVTVGAGAKWIDVYKKLEEKGLVVMGGRSSPAGVGGLTLQGGISFYSGRHGFVCSNAERYEVVLADGTVVTASASERLDLWRVLKGGGNNFAIVTQFTLRSFPLEPLWFGQMFAPAAFQQTKAMKAYHDYVERASSGEPGAFDENAAGPILSFVKIRGVPFHIMVAQLVYTKVRPEDNKQWPAHWKKTDFNALWSVYRNCSVRSHISAVEQNAKSAPSGTRHMQGTTTIRNDLETMQAAYSIFCQTTEAMGQVKGLIFPFTFQTILPGWMNKGHPNVLGLEDCTEPLIIIGCSVTWADAKDDKFVRTAVRRLLEQIDAAAAKKRTGHPYRFINYCMEFQRPYNGVGQENKKLMREASQKYDPDGLFQSGCAGGFKLPQ